ncbi:CUB and sushi domain-containing protein 1-like isoform X2 [Glandiceps talaboti]
MNMAVIHSALISVLVAMLVQKSDAQCDGGCCDCIPIEPPCFSCQEPIIPPPDTVPPVIHGCPVDMSRTMPAGRDTLSICWREPWASDNRGPAYIQPARQGPRPCSQFNEGVHTIGYTAGDFAGNTAMCQFTITIHAIVCTTLVSPPNARVTCSRENRQGSTCQYYCNSNYQLVSGSKQRVCGAGGRWSGTEAVCEMRRCEILMPPTNGRLRCRGGDVPGSTCTYVCSVGYFIDSGSETRRCRADGHWSGSEVRCEARRCSPLTAPTNGYLSCSGSKPGSNCHYRCDHGYHISYGSTTRVCSSEGEWSGTPAICEKRVVNCSPLSPPSNGHVSCQGDNQPGSWCQYDCMRGYKLVGARSRVCGNEGQWTGSNPTCESQSCGRLHSPANGRISCDGNSQGSRCQYVCNTGYRIGSGSEYRTCQAAGYGSSSSWSGTEAVCQAITCPVLNSPPHGYVKCNGNQYGSQCQYECSSGYTLARGTETRTCEANGQWSGSEVSCIVGGCSPLRSPYRGSVRCQGNNEVGTRCVYDCDEGYDLVGTEYRDCTRGSNGAGAVWSGSEPICAVEAVKFCDFLNNPKNAVKRCSTNDNRVGTYCDYICDPGYTYIRGHRRIECLEGGKWSLSKPNIVCRADTCVPLPSIPGGRIQCNGNGEYLVSTRCEYRCNQDFVLRPDPSSTVRICTPGGTWSGIEAYCEPRLQNRCVQLTKPENGRMDCDGDFSIGTVCEFTCLSGYRLSTGSQTRVCRRSGWSGREARCEATGCRTLSDPRYGSVRCEGHMTGDRCDYTCDRGYELTSGSRVRTCDSRGYWSGSKAVCSDTGTNGCQRLSDPLHGSVFCTGQSEGDVCEYTCDLGYSLTSGSRSRTCGRSGWTGYEPICSDTENDCHRLPDPPHGSVRCDGQSEGDTCEYTCDGGYSLTSGSRFRTCEGSRWTGYEPICTDTGNGCHRLSDIPHGSVRCNGQSQGDTCEYTCDGGYSLTSGSRFRTCEGGRWTGYEPICSDTGNGCHRLSDPPHGSVRCIGQSEGDTCEYTCDRGYSLTSGLRFRTCEGGRWTGYEPICSEEASCPRLPHPAYGTIRCEGLEVGHRCQYTCNRGYSLTGGSKERMCGSNGQWSGSEAVCSGVACEPLRPPDNGQVVCSGRSTYGCKCDYYCNIGYYVSGGSYTRYCDLTGKWTGRTPSCAAITVRCKNKYYCARSCGYSRCSASSNRLQRSIDTVRNRPMATPELDQDVADLLT